MKYDDCQLQPIIDHSNKLLRYEVEWHGDPPHRWIVATLNLDGTWTADHSKLREAIERGTA